MVGAVVAAIVLTLLLPDDLRLGPNWALPVLEAVLLVVLIVGDPGSITRRSRELRAVGIALVALAEEHVQDHRTPDDRGRDDDVRDDERRLAHVTTCGDDRRSGESGQDEPLRDADSEHESNGDRGEEAQPAESLDQRLRPAFGFSFAVVGLRRAWNAIPLNANARRNSTATWMPGWLLLS